jgi:hypothetical protein
LGAHSSEEIVYELAKNKSGQVSFAGFHGLELFVSDEHEYSLLLGSLKMELLSIRRLQEDMVSCDYAE